MGFLLFFTISTSYSERLTLINHTNFVSSVCVLEGGEWICTGSNDATICVYVAGNLEPFITLEGHTSTGKIISIIHTNKVILNIIFV